jgi:hypothetical protein
MSDRSGRFADLAATNLNWISDKDEVLQRLDVGQRSLHPVIARVKLGRVMEDVKRTTGGSSSTSAGSISGGSCAFR